MKPLNQCTCTIVDVRGAASDAVILIMLSRLFMFITCYFIYSAAKIARCADFSKFQMLKVLICKQNLWLG